ncbi:MAG: hypothetical protein GXC73_20820 [Chitinophagaceae bacterium]|nr:hypothetical protein [Chitinophagaceae bacterium]
MTYSEKLEQTKSVYPFNNWREAFFPNEEHGLEGMEQYSEENCSAAETILDRLIADLNTIGVDAPEEQKVKLFQTAVEGLNELNDENDGCLIETGEREDLCELFDQIAIAAGIDPDKYGDGDGIASEWRDW